MKIYAGVPSKKFAAEDFTCAGQELLQTQIQAEALSSSTLHIMVYNNLRVIVVDIAEPHKAPAMLTIHEDSKGRYIDTADIIEHTIEWGHYPVIYPNMAEWAQEKVLYLLDLIRESVEYGGDRVHRQTHAEQMKVQFTSLLNELAEAQVALANSYVPA